MIYVINNPDSEVFTISKSSLFDSTEAASVEVFSEDHSKVTNYVAPYENVIQFQVTVHFEEWSTSDFLFNYYDASETARIDDLGFKLKDYCLGAVYS